MSDREGEWREVRGARPRWRNRSDHRYRGCEVENIRMDPSHQRDNKKEKSTLEQGKSKEKVKGVVPVKHQREVESSYTNAIKQTKKNVLKSNNAIAGSIMKVPTYNFAYKSDAKEVAKLSKAYVGVDDLEFFEEEGKKGPLGLDIDDEWDQVVKASNHVLSNWYSTLLDELLLRVDKLVTSLIITFIKCSYKNLWNFLITGVSIRDDILTHKYDSSEVKKLYNFKQWSLIGFENQVAPED
ncbi:hypothetical protein VNO78_25377 [Psophocarpus tetragonolobus]|uniref:Uncharacterized protein n=1 Tax=Psophocarpus tetragonolobus TaxID=3891 RepID=A0AAN9SA05_PSOTE